MALKTRVGAVFAKRLAFYANGMRIGGVRSGLGPNPATSDLNFQVYGDLNGVQMRTYAPGNISVQVLENADSALVNIALSEYKTKAPTAPALIRSGPNAADLVAIVQMMDADLVNWANGSTLITNWMATITPPVGDPGGEAVRTVEGPADVPAEFLSGAHWVGRRVQLVSTSSGWQGSWTDFIPLAIPKYANRYSGYLEIQKGVSDSRAVTKIEADASNITASGSSGGKVLIPHSDVVDAGWTGVSGTDLHCYVVAAAGGTTVLAQDYRYGDD